MSESTILIPEIQMSSFMDESTHPFPGMDSRLYMAAEEGYASALNNLIQEINIFEQFTGLGNSVLHIALSSRKWQFVERVLEEVNRNLVAGREFVRAKNSDGNTALHLAAFHGHVEGVEKIVEAMKGDVDGGDDFLRSRNRDGNTALHQAAKGTYYSGIFMWGGYSQRKYIKVVEVLFNHHNDLINLPNNEGESALFLASQKGYTWIVKELLGHTAANSNMKRGDGQTPLHAAVLNGHTGVVGILLRHSPELAKETDNCGRTAMHMLALSTSYSAKIVGQLLARGNSLCYKEDNNKQTPIHLALEWQRYRLVNNLLLCGRDCIEAVDKDGRKPLHLALLNTTRLSSIFNLHEFKVMFSSLISMESVNHPDNSGRTPLQLAWENWGNDPLLYDYIIRLLEHHGARRNPVTLELMRSVQQSAGKATRVKAKNVSINSVLIATVSFAAAFTLPGGLDSEHQAVLLSTILFNVFVICDTLSFCASIASAILIQYEDMLDQQVAWAIRLLWLALVSLLVVFGAAINMVTKPSIGLALTVWTMVSFVPLYIFFCHKKTIFFMEERSTIWGAIVVLAFCSLVFFLYGPAFLYWILFGGLIIVFLSFRRTCQIRMLKMHTKAASGGRGRRVEWRL